MSDLICSGIPWIAKIFVNASMVDLADVLVTTSIAGDLDLSSITTRTSSPDGNGPQKSIATFCHGRAGISVMTSVSLCLRGMAACHGMHPDILASIFLSIPGNHTLLRSSCLLFTIPR